VAETDELARDIDAWATAHGFERTDEEIAGATPLLRLGNLGVTDDAYRGTVDGREAILAEFSIGSPDLSQAFGGGGLTTAGFTLFLVGVDASRWRRLTVHPQRYGDHHWMKRLLHIDREVDGLPGAFEERYQVIASTRMPEDEVRAAFDEETVAWWLAQPTEVVMDIEDHEEHGGYLAVAHPGVFLDAAELDDLHTQAEHLARTFTPAG
jgi:hypothetical protein